MMGIKTMQNFTLISKLLRKMQNLLTKKLWAKKCAKLEFLLLGYSYAKKEQKKFWGH
jgi:hypothetical protein